MKTATSLTLIAIGAILAFAVTAEPSFFSFHIAGWVLIVIGVVGVVLPRRGYGWLRRRLVLTGNGRRVVIDRGQRPRRLPKLLQNGVITRQPENVIAGEPFDMFADDPLDTLADGPVDASEAVERDTIEQYIEE
jgi:hypothetical protein